jgi:hypothetical protein
MAYTIPEIITWMKICQPLARVGEAKRFANGDISADVDLDIKLYMTRRDIEYAYAQNADADILHSIGNFGLALCGVYLFQAQATTVGGGTITPITPGGIFPDPYDFDVSATSFIVTGATSKVFPSSWIGLNILLIRGHITQSKVNNGVDDYYSWDRTTATIYFFGQAPSTGAAVLGENIQIYPI